MADYINREAVRNELYDADAITMKGVAILNNFPSADVVEVKHGEWVVCGGGMARDCQNCTQKCPQAERANQAALGRMYATKEFIALLKKVESGELVEVVRCKYCKHRTLDSFGGHCCKLHKGLAMVTDESFCSYGETEC